MLELALAGGQSLGNLVQAVRPSQLAEQHGQELTPGGEAARMALGFVLLHRLLKLG
jgi:hypothetical protein